MNNYESSLCFIAVGRGFCPSSQDKRRMRLSVIKSMKFILFLPPLLPLWMRSYHFALLLHPLPPPPPKKRGGGVSDLKLEMKWTTKVISLNQRKKNLALIKTVRPHPKLTPKSKFRTDEMSVFFPNTLLWVVVSKSAYCNFFFFY